MSTVQKNKTFWLATASTLVLVPITSIVGVFYSFVFVIAGLSVPVTVYWIANSPWVGAILIITADLVEVGYHFPGLPLTLAKLVTAVVALGLFFFYLRKKDQKIFRFSKLDLIIFLLGLMTSLSSIYNDSFSITNSRGILRFFSFLIVYFVISRSLKTKQQIVRILYFMIFGGLVLLIFQWLEYLSRFEGVSENFGKNSLAAQLAVLAVVAFILATDSRNKLFLWIIGGFNIFAIFINSSRGALLAFLAAMMFLLVSQIKSRKVIVVSIFVIIAMGYVAQALPKSEYSNSITRLVSTSTFEHEKRVRIWRAGWMLIKNNSVWGIGYGNFSNKIGDYSSERGIFEVVGHSMYITTASESGIFSLLIFLCILGYSFYKINSIRSGQKCHFEKSETTYLLALQAGLIVYAVNGIFLDTHFEADFWIFLGIVQAVILVSGNLETQVRAHQDAQPRAENKTRSSFADISKNIYG